MARHNFSPQTVKLLAERVGYHCSNPSCGVATIGPSSEPDKKEYVGIAAHIYSASIDNGPRANPRLSEEERKSINNGIHLCNKCSTLIDKNDGTGYPAQLLIEWKRCAEEAARARIYTTKPYVLYKRVYFSNLEKKYSTALTCSGLGEKNVLSCPSNRLLISDISCKLKLAKKCIIRGSSGSGKSLVTYQVAKDFHDKGWSVHKLDKFLVTENTLLVAPSEKSLIIVDDAQTLTSNTVENIINFAYDECMVLVNWNSSTSLDSDFLRNYHCVDVIPSVQVDIIKKFCLDNKEYIESLLNEVAVETNPRDYYKRIETRIERASQEDTPWLFNYTLTEGWHAAKADMEMLRSKDQLNLAIVTVAAYQYSTLDNGVSQEVIIESLRNYNDENDWLNRARDTIKEYCVNSDGLIKNKHYEYSKKVLQIFISKKENNNYSSFLIGVFRNILLNKLYEMGHSNILEFLMFEYRYCQHILNNDGTILSVANDLFVNDTSLTYKKIEKLNSLIRFNKETINILDLKIDSLRAYIINCDRNGAYPLANLINTLHNEKYSGLLIDNHIVDAILAKIISSKMEDKSRFSYLYNRIHLFLDETTREYVINRLINSNFTVDLSNYNVGIECYHFSSLINYLACASSEWASINVEKNIDSIATLMNKDLMESYRYLKELIEHYFGVIGRILGIKNEDKERKKLAKRLSRRISVATIVSAFESIETIDVQDFTSILIFILMSERKKILEISERINYDKLRKLYEGDIVLDHHHKNMIRILHNPNSEKYSAYICELINSHNYIDDLFLALNPNLSLSKIRSGTPFKMKFHDCSECKRTLEIVKFIEEECCKDLAFRVVSENIEEIKKCIYSKSLNVDDKKEKYDFLVYIHKIYPAVLKAVFDDNEKVSELFTKINRIIKGKSQEKNIARLYVCFIKYYTKDFKTDIEKIERRYTSVRSLSIE